MTSWEPVIYSPASRIFEKESEALEWCIDQAETRVRDLSRQIFHAYDREADERAEQFPNEDDDLSNDSSGVEGHAGEQKCDDPTLLNPKPSTSGFQRAEMPSNARHSVTEPSENQASPAVTSSNSPADVPSEGRGEWMPIETAPKDTFVIVCGTRSDGSQLMDVAAMNPGCSWFGYLGSYPPFEPTHWQPLPPPPMLPTEGSGA